MKSFFEDTIGTLMDAIRSEINELVKNESLNFDELIEQKDDPLIGVIPTLPLTFNGEKWAGLVRLAKPSFSVKLSDDVRMSVTALVGTVMDKASNSSKGKVNKISKTHNTNQPTTSSANTSSFKANAPPSPRTVFHILLSLFKVLATLKNFADFVKSSYKNALKHLNLDTKRIPPSAL